MSTKLLLIIFIIFAYISCGQNRREKIEEIIAGKEYKYWCQDRFDTSFSKDTFKYRLVYFLDRKGNCYMFIKFPYKNFVFTGHTDKIWELINDSTINLSGLPNKIISLTDTMLVISNKDKDRETLYRVQDTIVPIAYRILK